MTDHYDVIIIGSGAGGGTLAHTLAALGQADPAPRAGRLPAAGDGQLEPRAGVRRRQVHLQGHLVRRRRQAVPAPGPLLRRRRHQALRRRAVPAAARRTSASSTTSTASRRLAADLRRLRAVVHEGRVALPGARQRTARTRPRATGRKQYPWPAVSHEPRIQQISDDLARRRLPPVPRAVRDPARRGRPGHAARASAAPGATATRAWCTPRPTPRRSRCARSSTCPTSRCSSAPRSTRLETDDAGPHGHRRRRVPRRRPRRSTAADIVVVSAGAANSAKLLLRSANDRHPNGLANGSDQVGRNYMFHNCKAVVALAKEPNDTVFQKTLGHQRLLPRRTTTTSGRSATSRWSASPTPRR